MKVRALVWAGAMALWAQSAPVTVSLSAPVKGPVELTIRNHGRAAVTAYAVTVSYTANGNTATQDLIWDSMLRLSTPDLEPNEAAVRRVAISPANASVALRAVVFADGRTSGESAWVGRIASERRFALATIDGVRQILPAAKPEDLEAAHREKLATAAGPEQRSLIDAYYRLATPRHARDLDLLRARLAGAVSPAVN
ncbi:MAG: hypothetical protein ABSH45_04875 [Bryobacteraceae bacterium]